LRDLGSVFGVLVVLLVAMASPSKHTQSTSLEAGAASL
jgi:hypothetical protein